MARAGKIQYPILLLRLALGWLFFYAGIIKVFDGSWSALGYLQNAKTFPEFYSWFASPGLIGLVNFINQWGLVFIGLGLLFGVAFRWAVWGGIALMVLYYFPVLNFPYVGDHALLIDDHIIYIIGLWLLLIFKADKQWSLQPYIDDIDFVAVAQSFVPDRSSKNGRPNVRTAYKEAGSGWLGTFGIPSIAADASTITKYIIFGGLSIILSGLAVWGISDGLSVIVIIILFIVFAYLFLRMFVRITEVIGHHQWGLIFVLLLVAFILMFVSTEYKSVESCIASDDQVTTYTYGGWPVQTVLLSTPDVSKCSVPSHGPVANFLFWLMIVVSIDTALRRARAVSVGFRSEE